jgi:hypothetical protein
MDVDLGAPRLARAPRPRPRAEPAELSPRELERVTTHVVDALDRRLAAFRERRGRS